MDKKIWRVLFMVYANKKEDADFAAYVEVFLQSLLKAKLSPFISYVLMKNVVDDSGETDLSEHDKSEFYELVNNGKQENELKLLCTVSTPLLLFKTDEIIVELLKVFSKFPAEKTFVTTWDHGSFFGIYRYEFKTTILKILLSEYHYEDFFKPVLRPSLDKLVPHNTIRFQQIYNRWWDDSIGTLSASSIKKDSFEYKNELVEQIRALIYQKEKDNKRDFFYEGSLFQAVENYLVGGNECFEFEQQFANTEIADNNRLNNSGYDMLENEDLSKILNSVFGKVDVLLMMNCYMQNLHTAYSLKDVVSVLIAPQGDMELPGYYFEEILSFLAENPLASNEVIARKIIKGTIDLGKQSTSNQAMPIGTYHISDLISLFATKPKLSEAITFKINDLSNYLQFKINTDLTQNWRSIIRKARKACFEFETSRPYGSIDIVSFLSEIRKIITNQSDIIQMEVFANEFQSFCSTYIIMDHRGPAFVRYADRWETNGLDKNILPYALSIYFPIKEMFKRDIGSRRLASNSDLMKNTNWMKFLENLYM